MSSLVKGIIGAVAGCILFPFILSMEGGYGITDILLFIPVGALYGFGFAFGIAWIPGVVKGIKDIVRERRAA